jgi:hypothetical protein
VNLARGAVRLPFAHGDFTQTSELTPRQRELHAALGVPEPPRFGCIATRQAA